MLQVQDQNGHTFTQSVLADPSLHVRKAACFVPIISNKLTIILTHPGSSHHPYVNDRLIIYKFIKL